MANFSRILIQFPIQIHVLRQLRRFPPARSFQSRHSHAGNPVELIPVFHRFPCTPCDILLHPAFGGSVR
ncbi:MAG: hypothetical protein ACKPJD_21210, partial [Planctomycetaceae bacterium]